MGDGFFLKLASFNMKKMKMVDFNNKKMKKWALGLGKWAQFQ